MSETHVLRFFMFRNSPSFLKPDKLDLGNFPAFQSANKKFISAVARVNIKRPNI